MLSPPTQQKMWEQLAVCWGILEISRHSPIWVSFFRQRLGLTVQPGVILFETSAVNGPINRLGENWLLDPSAATNVSDGRTFYGKVQSCLDIFYVCGAIVFGVIQLALYGLLAFGALSSLFALVFSGATITEVSDKAPIRPVVPGYNMQGSEVD